MHPALSVIVFTSLSGAGYGLLFLLCLMMLTLQPAEAGRFYVTGLGLATILISVGLVSSTLHLGHPERAWRALSQWRSSWLSREGVSAVATYLPLAVLGLASVTGSAGWTVALAAALAAVGAGLTVYCTAMIYASLRPIRQWHNRYVPVIYLAFAFMSGAGWLAVVASASGLPGTVPGVVIIATALAAWILKALYWRDIAASAPVSTIGTATGLSGDVRVFDPPHTEDNYLLKEMGFRIGRRHSTRLRRFAVLAGLVLPVALTAAQLLWLSALTPWLALPAAVSLSLGVLTERWLFFAEAEHTVTLYYRRAQELAA